MYASNMSENLNYDEYERPFTPEEKNEMVFHEQISNGWDAMNLDLRSIAIFCLMKYRIQSMVAASEQLKWQKKNKLETDTQYSWYNFSNCNRSYLENYHPAKLVLFDGTQPNVVKINFNKGNTSNSYYWQTHLNYLIKKNRLRVDVDNIKEVAGYDLNDIEEVPDDKELILTWLPDLDASIGEGDNKKTWGKYVYQDYDYFPIYTERGVKYHKHPVYYVLERNIWADSEDLFDYGLYDPNQNPYETSNFKWGLRDGQSYRYWIDTDNKNRCIDVDDYPPNTCALARENFLPRPPKKPRWVLSCYSYGMTLENSGIPTKQEIFLDVRPSNKLKWFTYIPIFQIMVI